MLMLLVPRMDIDKICDFFLRNHHKDEWNLKIWKCSWRQKSVITCFLDCLGDIHYEKGNLYLVFQMRIKGVRFFNERRKSTKVKVLINAFFQVKFIGKYSTGQQDGHAHVLKVNRHRNFLFFINTWSMLILFRFLLRLKCGQWHTYRTYQQWEYTIRNSESILKNLEL